MDNDSFESEAKASLYDGILGTAHDAYFLKWIDIVAKIITTAEPVVMICFNDPSDSPVW